ncbi:hypothetical protein [Piscinibacter terrae]|uniref:Uncharacterized protein n=1 Tax=Piscinibacter terrae TaxID=2496871 RepID=A0A3N7JIJ9_9BURK|nr:hypothetical protein [Albitalea terrae]RQP21269.1 hypothetical protein DZC73_28960 [Albitalea terrae]
MTTPPVDKPVTTAQVDKQRRTPAAPLVSPVQRDRFEQALKRASHDADEEKPEAGAHETAMPWPIAAQSLQHAAAMPPQTPVSTPAVSPTEAAMGTSLRHGTAVHHAGSPTTAHLSVELTDTRLPLAAIDVQRIGTRIDVALTGHTATRTDLSPMALGRLRERLSARGAELGALTWTSTHHDEDEHDEH